MGLLTKKQQLLNSTIGSAFEIYQEEEARVEDYYGQFY